MFSIYQGLKIFVDVIIYDILHHTSMNFTDITSYTWFFMRNFSQLVKILCEFNKDL